MFHIATSIYQHHLPFLSLSIQNSKQNFFFAHYTILALPTMEAFSLLKYWRGGGAAPAPAPAPAPGLLSSSSTTVLTALPPTQNATDSDNDDDDGPFFDLEFTVPDDFDDPHDNPEPNHSSSSSSSSSSDHDSQEEEEEEDEDNIIEGEREFKFTLSPSANDRGESLSPSDDLFFKGKLVQLDPSSFEVEPNSKPPQFTASLFKSATKFRVFMSGLKKSKSNTTTTATTDSVATNPKHPDTQQQIPESQKKQQQQQQQQPVPDRKLFTVKFKVEEVPIVSLFTRDNSSKGNNNKSKQNPEDSPSSSSKEVIMHKYLKMVKPLYVRRVSRRYGDKLGFSGHLNLNPEAKPAPPPAMAEKKQADGGPENAGTNGKTQKQGNLPAGLRVVCKHLGKSRSASSTLAAAPPSALLSSKRRDDSLLQQQDGIQGAILHCKRSFNASRECQSSQLPRSVSDPLHEIPSQLSRKSSKDKRL